MNHSKEVMEFLASPDTVEFVARGTDAFLDYVSGKSNVVITQTLSGRYILGSVHKDAYLDLMQPLGSGFISSSSIILGPLDRPSMEVSGISLIRQHPFLALQGRGVLIGFVDTGIDYTLPCFRYEDGSTKIQFLYDQTGEGGAPKDFFYGREHTREDIDEALRARDPYTRIPQRDEIGHGTYLASVAAGRQVEGFIGAAPDAELIVVKLKPAKPFYREQLCVPPEQMAAYESSAVMVGVEYIVRRARELGRPVVICLGMGSNSGSHDGFSIFEEYLSYISYLPGVCLCVAAGNESQERHHMSGQITAAGETRNIDIKIGEKAGDVGLSIWNGVADRLSVSIRSPSGELVSRVPARHGVPYQVKLVMEKTQVSVEYHFPVEGSGGQLSYVRILGATPGIWTVTLHGDLVLNGEFDVWLPMSGFVAENVEFLASSPEKTVVVPATAVGVICCGAYDPVSQNLYLKSSWGPSRTGVQLPDLVAPGVNVEGFLPYGLGVMSGTSVAAAITAGACALLLQWGVVEENSPAMSTYQIRAHLIRGCEHSPAVSYPNERWGYGVLNLLSTFQLMREL